MFSYSSDDPEETTLYDLNLNNQHDRGHRRCPPSPAQHPPATVQVPENTGPGRQSAIGQGSQWPIPGRLESFAMGLAGAASYSVVGAAYATLGLLGPALWVGALVGVLCGAMGSR